MTEQSNNSTRGYIELSGPDSRKFLQGQVTCDMTTLSQEQSIYGAQCTPRGRIIFLFKASCDEQNNIILQTHSSIVEIAIASLKKYAVFFKTKIVQIDGQGILSCQHAWQNLAVGWATRVFWTCAGCGTRRLSCSGCRLSDLVAPSP